ncbi:putative divalent heavy-metal cations transporter [Methanonatronarchaeum thermophilum]|uniref:Putative divalent heavy-metal cations transporter n=1 Tax=Methanonatronarchaeum thermophilum TaxID=1927129 RepID=A0A1Y3GBT6_9EURY|nr:ZIP family metal transporter [Methanonatronarchaeum thermophilum]OUJ18921.1 putative divalent heavy-metal cations transporter [Methanonatronarchaeum thermophilum]
MFEYLAIITVIGLLSGVLGTGSGGLFVVLFKRIKESSLSVLLGFSAGVMVAITFVELIPESIEEGSLFTGLVGLVLGIVVLGFLDFNFPHKHFSFDLNGSAEKAKQLKTGLLLSVGIAMHNLPEGVAIGTALLVNFEVGVTLAVLMAIHNFPEGMAAATAMGVGEIKNSRILLVTALAGVPMGIGAFIGGALGGVSEIALSISLGFAGGAMLYIVFDELIPDSHRRATGHTAIIGILSGIVIGITFIELLH